MAENSKISWTKSTHQLTAGCSPKGPECQNCYAIKEVWRLSSNPNPKIASAYEGLVERFNGRLRWTGEVRLLRTNLESINTKPLKDLVFIDSLADLFDEKVPFSYLADVVCRLREDRGRTYQILTKEPRRMKEFFGSAELNERFGGPWTPAENIAIGTSIGVGRSLWRAFEIASIPAFYRFISLEPLLEVFSLPDEALPYIGQAIIGGESGSKRDARPMPLEGARLLRNQLKASNVNLDFKQHGAWTWIEHPGKSTCQAHGMTYWYVNHGGKHGICKTLDGQEWREPLKKSEDPYKTYGQ